MISIPKHVRQLLFAIILFHAIVFAYIAFQLDFKTAVRFIGGLSALLLLPGLSLSYAFWGSQHFDPLERILLSIALSIATVPTIMFMGTKFGIKITGASTSLVILTIIAVGVLGMIIRRFFDRRSKQTPIVPAKG